MKHRLRKRGKLHAAHPAPNHSHQPSSNLVVGNPLASHAFNEKLNLFAGKFRAVSLFADEVNNSHEEGYAANLASPATHVNECERRQNPSSLVARHSAKGMTRKGSVA